MKKLILLALILTSCSLYADAFTRTTLKAIPAYLSPGENVISAYKITNTANIPITFDDAKIVYGEGMPKGNIHFLWDASTCVKNKQVKPFSSCYLYALTQANTKAIGQYKPMAAVYYGQKNGPGPWGLSWMLTPYSILSIKK